MFFIEIIIVVIFEIILKLFIVFVKQLVVLAGLKRLITVDELVAFTTKSFIAKISYHLCPKLVLM